MTMTEPLARRSDPLSSHLAVGEIAKDRTLSDRIVAEAVGMWHDAAMGRRDSAAWTDTEMWRRLEAVTGQRLQRNVIARARQLLCDTERHPVKNPLIAPVGMFMFEGRPMLHFIATAAL